MYFRIFIAEVSPDWKENLIKSDVVWIDCFESKEKREEAYKLWRPQDFFSDFYDPSKSDIRHLAKVSKGVTITPKAAKAVGINPFWCGCEVCEEEWYSCYSHANKPWPAPEFNYGHRRPMCESRKRLLGK